jgi:hypothetical protein
MCIHVPRQAPLVSYNLQCLGLLVCLFHSGVCLPQPRLAPSVQADLLREKIDAQANADHPDAMLVSLDQYHKLVHRLKLVFSPPLYFVEANAAHEAGDATRALSALIEFLHRAYRNSDQYKDALALYPQYPQLAKGSVN